MTQNELERYREYLQFLAKNNKSDIFTNEDTSHAATVLTEMFDNTNGKAIMLCHKLSDDVFTADYKTAFNNFLERPNSSIKIMVKSAADRHKGFFGELLQNKKDNLEIRIVAPEAVDEISKSLGLDDCDFAVFDNKMFRLEYDPDQRKSIGSFNKPEIAETLTQRFNEYFSKAQACTSSSGL